VCFNCDNVVADEVHVLLECPLYANIRNSLLEYARLIHNDFDSLNNRDKSCSLLSTNNHVLLGNVPKPAIILYVAECVFYMVGIYSCFEYFSYFVFNLIVCVCVRMCVRSCVLTCVWYECMSATLFMQRV
jgi:hypothetical protein